MKPWPWDVETSVQRTHETALGINLQERQADWRPPLTSLALSAIARPRNTKNRCVTQSKMSETPEPCQRGRTPWCVRERRHGAEVAVAWAKPLRGAGQLGVAERSALPVPRLRVEPEASARSFARTFPPAFHGPSDSGGPGGRIGLVERPCNVSCGDLHFWHLLAPSCTQALGGTGL